MFSPHDRAIVRDLAKRVAEIAALPIMAERKREWKRHNSLQPGRPMILFFPEGAWVELIPGDALECEDARARSMEFDLRHRIYAYEHFDTDNVVEAEWIVHKVIHNSGWGLNARHVDSPVPRGAWAFDPIIKGPGDLEQLRHPRISHDEEATQRNLAQAQELLGDILDVRLKGVAHLSFHLMNLYTGWRGLEQVFMDMVTEPRMLHAAMAFLEEGHHRMMRQYQEQNLLSLNNDNTYHSTGGNGYTDELPPTDCDPNRIRPCDMWASAEAQELDPVSPAMHEEFSLQYERRLLAPFGLNGYACCDDLSPKIEDVLTIPNIRRLSIAPSADVDVCAEKLGDRAIFSWKPQPSHLVGRFDPDRVRAYLQHTLEVTRGCVLEIILKDTHTCQHHPERFDEWSRIARALVENGR